MDWLGDNIWAFWLALTVLLLIGEFASLDLVLLMLAVGTGAATLATFLVDPWPAHLLTAVVVALTMIFVVRPSLLRRLHSSPGVAVGPERLIDVRAQAPDGIAPNATVQLKIDGELWSAVLAPGADGIPAGGFVRVQSISGATAIVVPDPAS